MAKARINRRDVRLMGYFSSMASKPSRTLLSAEPEMTSQEGVKPIFYAELRKK
jgi:hypothetical protein